MPKTCARSPRTCGSRSWASSASPCRGAKCARPLPHRRGVHKAVDEVRRSEAAELTRRGRTVLKHKRWILLKSPENLTEPQAAKLADLVKANLRTVRAYLLKEDLRQLWDFFSPARACAFLVGWCRRARATRVFAAAVTVSRKFG